MPENLQTYFDQEWMAENILKDHGPLCSSYRTRKDGSFWSEGDSPALLHLIDSGLRSLEDPGFGGWGGRFSWQHTRWVSAPDDGDIHKPILRWTAAFQNDWAVRADWCVKEYDEANHPPIVVLTHAANLKARGGKAIRLDATGSEDPDGSKLTYHWWHYREPGTYPGTVNIKNADEPEASFNVPRDAGDGETIHIICEVTDGGTPPLTRYQRVIVEALN